MSLCDDCENKRKTWADSLADDGYTGCVIGYHHPEYIHDIDAEIVATGWVILNMAVNNQIIVRNVRKCPHKNK